jgi:hypothetical protein
MLEIFTFPYVVSVTYSDRSESPNHTITYTTNKLKWDNNTNINNNGAAELTLFDISYEDVEAQDKNRVIAPGTEGMNIVRLRNAANNKIQYKAVLYKYETTNKLPLDINMVGDNFITTKDYQLPKNINKDEIEIIKAVKGTLGSKKIQDFDIEWQWNFFTSHEQDIIDTMLGNKKQLDEVLIGFYIVVEDGSTPDDNDRPGGGGSIIIIKPDKPDDPQNPDNPNNPDNPIIPDDPNVPDNPNNPDLPDIPIDPDDPQNPDDPSQPDIPNIPDNPNQPDTPEISDDKDKPNVIHPEIPQTGDDRLFGMYITLMIISGIVLLLLIIEKRLEKRK